MCWRGLGWCNAQGLVWHVYLVHLLGVASQNCRFSVRIAGNHLWRKVGWGGKQQEILAGDNHRGSMGEIECETERGSVRGRQGVWQICGILCRRSCCPPPPIQQHWWRQPPSLVDPAAGHANSSLCCSSRGHRVQPVLQHKGIVASSLCSSIDKQTIATLLTSSLAS